MQRRATDVWMLYPSVSRVSRVRWLQTLKAYPIISKIANRRGEPLGDVEEEES